MSDVERDSELDDPAAAAHRSMAKSMAEGPA